MPHLQVALVYVGFWERMWVEIKGMMLSYLTRDACYMSEILYILSQLINIIAIRCYFCLHCVADKACPNSHNQKAIEGFKARQLGIRYPMLNHNLIWEICKNDKFWVGKRKFRTEIKCLQITPQIQRFFQI